MVRSPPYFRVHDSYASGNVKYLNCHLSSQDHLIVQRVRELTGGSSPWSVTMLPSLMAIGTVLLEI